MGWIIVAQSAYSHAMGQRYIDPKYYKHLKKVLNKAIWADKKWTGFWQISLYIK